MNALNMLKILNDLLIFMLKLFMHSHKCVARIPFPPRVFSVASHLSDHRLNTIKKNNKKKLHITLAELSSANKCF